MSPPDPPTRVPLDRAYYSTLRRIASDPEARFVVSFGAGAGPALAGNLALAAILEELGLKERADEIWGVSAGAVVGAPWASGASAATMRKQLGALDRKGSIDVAWGEILRGALRAARGGAPPAGLVRGRNFAEALRSGLLCETIEECPIVFRCIAASDDGLARKKIFRRGKLLDAVLCSMNIPGVFLPRPPDEEGRSYVDGAVVESTPLASPLADHARLHPGKKLVIVGTRFRRGTGAAAEGFLARMLRSMQAMQAQLWDRQLADARGSTHATVLVLEARFDDAELFDFAKLGLHESAARSKFAEELQDGRISALLGAG